MEGNTEQAMHSFDKKQRAKDHVERLKSWYWQIPVNLIATATLGALSFLMYANNEPATIIWILMSGPMALWIIFIVQGLSFKRMKFICKWEERQVRKYMKQNKIDNFSHPL